MIRPEYLHVGAAGTRAAGDSLVGSIANIAFLGAYTRVTVATAAGELEVVQTHGGGNEFEVTLGEEVCVWWPADRAAVIGT
jgi:hypothetical protein